MDKEKRCMCCDIVLEEGDDFMDLGGLYICSDCMYDNGLCDDIEDLEELLW